MEQAVALPRTARYLARAHLGLAAVVALAGLVGGVAMQLELWSPGGAWGAEHYDRMLHLHTLLVLALGAPALAGGCGYPAVASIVETRRTPAPALAWIGLAFFSVGFVAAAVDILRPAVVETGWTFYTPTTVGDPASGHVSMFAPLVLASAGLVYAAHLSIVIAVRAPAIQPTALALAAGFAAAIAIACVRTIVTALSLDGVSALSPPTASLLVVGARFAALVLATIVLVASARRGELARPTLERLALAAIACAAVWAYAPFSRVFAVGVIGLWIAIAIVGRASAPAAVAVFAIAPVLATHAVARAVGQRAGIPVNDTYVVVGEYHALAAIVALSALGATLAWARSILGRRPNSILATIGVVACGGGILVHVWAAIGNGAGGMPRRYWNYDPVLQSLHRLAGGATAVAIAGVLLLAIAWAIGARSEAVREREQAAVEPDPRIR